MRLELLDTMNEYTILKEVNECFSSTSSPSESYIFIFFLCKTGQILYQDIEIEASVLKKLISDKKIKQEIGDFYHQGYKCIRYRFIGYKYDEKYYRSISKKLRSDVMDRDNHSCVYCGETAYHKLTIDHITPWSLGGLTTFYNLQVLCRACNSKKSNK